MDDERIEKLELISLLAVANSNRNVILGNTRIYKSTITNTTNGTPVSISFDTIIYDTNNSFSLNDPTKITITKSGLYQTTGQLSYATNGTGIRKVNLVLNDISVIRSTAVPAATGDLTNISSESIYRLIAGDFIRLQGFQSSGGSLDIAVNSGYSQVLTLTRISD
ncbi:hypothetical protein EHQ96_00035 [Leptospira levettii]|uniref:hypothetical protein n=1 Tax=Leptospira levettii TaxID=2023178 RepID=UPI0010841789|nr:hypothetical protein [Leptospira levettii]MCG6150304.1 hypothetical protein [Leptospira levettii]TGM73630.1 hypothetical protein EHQ96_00035 [Leptospira levettii]